MLNKKTFVKNAIVLGAMLSLADLLLTGLLSGVWLGFFQSLILMSFVDKWYVIYLVVSLACVFYGFSRGKENRPTYFGMLSKYIQGFLSFLLVALVTILVSPDTFAQSTHFWFSAGFCIGYLSVIAGVAWLQKKGF